MSARMKVVILAGGLGTRLSEETEVRPKPMVEIGGHPIIWHIMKHYAGNGFQEFVVALGYKGEDIKRFFLDYNRLRASVTVDLSTGGSGQLDRAPYRHRPQDQHRRPCETTQAVARRRDLHAYLRRRPLRHRPQRPA